MQIADTPAEAGTLDVVTAVAGALGQTDRAPPLTRPHARAGQRRSPPARARDGSGDRRMDPVADPDPLADLPCVPANDRIDPLFVREAARLYQSGLIARRPLDAVVADFLREHLHGKPDPHRGFVVDAAQAMWRRRRLIEAVEKEHAKRIDEPTPEALVCASLLLDGVAIEQLPVAQKEARALKRVVDDVVANASLEVRSSLPPWLCDRLARRGGEALALSSTSRPPQTLRVNTLKTTREQLLAALKAEGIDAEACQLSPVGVVVPRRRNVFRTASFRTGLFEVQDEGSQLVALLADARPGQRVVDGCAGAGGKTLALAAAMQNKGSLIAMDVHGGRLKALQERAARAGVHNVRVHDLDQPDGSGKKAIKRLKAQCDVVVVDAPCSGSGVLRRNPDTGWTLEQADVDRLQGIQRELVDRYAALVKPGGVLVYATCSLLDDENLGIIDGFLGRDASFTLEPAGARLRAQGVMVDVGDVLALDPVRHGTDGFFAAVLRKG